MQELINNSRTSTKYHDKLWHTKKCVSLVCITAKIIVICLYFGTYTLGHSCYSKLWKKRRNLDHMRGKDPNSSLATEAAAAQFCSLIHSANSDCLPKQ